MVFVPSINLRKALKQNLRYYKGHHIAILSTSAITKSPTACMYSQRNPYKAEAACTMEFDLVCGKSLPVTFSVHYGNILRLKRKPRCAVSMRHPQTSMSNLQVTATVEACYSPESYSKSVQRKYNCSDEEERHKITHNIPFSLHVVHLKVRSIAVEPSTILKIIVCQSVIQRAMARFFVTGAVHTVNIWGTVTTQIGRIVAWRA